MSYICGNAVTSCSDYNEGMCKGFCDNSCDYRICVPRDVMSGKEDVAVAQIRYLAKILQNQKDIMNDIARLHLRHYK